MLGGSLTPVADIPSPESVVNWLIEHQESLPADDTDSESVSSEDYDSEMDSTSDDFEDLDSSGEVKYTFDIHVLLSYEENLPYAISIISQCSTDNQNKFSSVYRTIIGFNDPEKETL